MFEDLEDNVQYLIKLQTNLSKSKNNRIRTNTLKEKLFLATQLYSNIEESLLIHEKEIPEKKLHFFIKASRDALYEINQIIKQKIRENGEEAEPVNIEKMASPKVDLKLGTALVQTYDGSAEHLTTFLDAVTLFNSSVEETFADATAVQKNAAETTVVRFVRTRLTGKARQVVTDNQTLAEILDAVKTHCASRVTAENLIAKMSTIKQNDDVSNFCDQIEKITTQLKSVYMTDKIPEITAHKMATKCGVDALVNGTKSNEVKIILRAGTFSHVNDAIQKLQENQNSNQPTREFSQNNAQIMLAFRNGNRGRGNFQQNRNSRGRFQPQRYGNSQQSRGNYQSFRGNFRQNRGYYRYPHQRGNFSQRGQFNHNHGMFVAQGTHTNQENQQHLPTYQQLHQPHLPQAPLIPQQPHPLGVAFGQHTQ